jgi:hypothetical protein
MVEDRKCDSRARCPAQRDGSVVSTPEPPAPGKPAAPTGAKPAQAALTVREEGDEPAVEKAETLRLPLRNWVFLWAVPVVVVIVVLVIVIALTNP